MRLFVRLAIFALAPLMAQAAAAQSYPSRAVQVIVPFSAGQSTDIIARAFVQVLSTELGQPFVVNDIPGASGILAFNAAAHAAPDGYTLVMAPQGQLTIQPHLKKKLEYKFDTFTPICQLFENVFAITVKPGSPIRTFKDLVERARAKPGAMTWATSGIATVSDLQMSDLIQKLGLKLVHVSYRNYGQMIQDVIGGTVDFAVPSVGSFSPSSVQMVVLMADKRMAQFPDLPTITESGYSISLPGFGGLYTPAAAPKEVKDKLAAVCPKIFASEQFQRVMKNTMQIPAYLPGAEFAKRLAQDSAQKAALIKTLGLDKQEMK